MGVARLLLIVALLASPLGVAAEESGDEVVVKRNPTPAERFARKMATFVPSRIVDFLDIVRFRVRVGSGFASSFRLTRPISATTGHYSSFYMGLHGPRADDGAEHLPLPFGFEEYDWDRDPYGERIAVPPYYGVGEVGFGVQLGGPGLDIGIDPWEAVDFATGFLLFDLRDDDF